jgi:hypothetical protein
MSQSAHSINLDSMIRGAFTSAEIEILHTFPAFTTGLQTVKTVDEFEALCLIGHELLLEKGGGSGRAYKSN